MTTTDLPSSPPGRSTSIPGRLLGLFSSITFGVILLSVLFVYSSIGSAGVWLPNWLVPFADSYDDSAWIHVHETWTQLHVRQAPGLEMTEFEWFHWWPFDLTIGLICVTLIVTTLRRIPFKVINYGVWMIHTGIIILCIGSVIYFGTKIEGDAPVLRRDVLVELPGYEPVVVPAVPGNRAVIGEGPNGYLLEVTGIDPQWELLSGDDKGKRAFKVTVSVTTATSFFMRDMVAGYPQYTQDLIRTDDPRQPMQRAVNAIGKPLVDEQLSLALQYEPQEYMYLANNISKSWALYVREKGTPQWSERPLHGLPLYNDYVNDRSSVWPNGTAMKAVRGGLDVAAKATDDNDPLRDAELRISSYLRYAQMRSQRIDGDQLDPVASVLLDSGTGVQKSYDLVALDAQQNLEEGGRLGFAWAASQEQLEALGESRPAVLTVTVPGTDIAFTHEITDTLSRNPDLPFNIIEGTDYEWRVRFVQDSLRMTTEDRTIAVAAVEIRRGPTTFIRWASNDPAITRDMELSDTSTDVTQHGGQLPLDTGIEMTYTPVLRIPVPVLLIAGPDPDDLVLQLAIRGQAERLDVTIGEPIPIDAGISLSVTNYRAMTSVQTMPFIVPKSQRQSDAREQFAMVQVSIPVGGGATQSVWVPFHMYPVADVNHNFRRFRYQPAEVQLADGRVIELLFSRQRRLLPADVVLEDFQLTTHVGGFSGSVASIRDWTSMVRFSNDSGWSSPRAVSVNKPIEHDGLWYFQAQWDPPTGPRFEGDRPYPGLNYTVLGIGNRNGVVIQLIGCIIAVLGMLYAFYVKPVIKRRRQQAVYGRGPGAGGQSDDSQGGATMPRIGKATSGAMILLACLATLATPAVAQDEGEGNASFLQQVDFDTFGTIAVQTDGRVKSFESYATSMMRLVRGPKSLDGAPATVTYVDMMLRPGRYVDTDTIYVKKKLIRVQINQALMGTPEAAELGFDEPRAEQFLETGHISERALLARPVVALFERLSTDLRRSAKFVNMIGTALDVKSPGLLLTTWRVIPPMGDDTKRPWMGFDQLMAPGVGAPILDIPEERRQELNTAWEGLVNGWLTENVEEVNASAARLAELLPAINPTLYPETARLSWESFYFRAYNLTWFWVFYALCLPALLLHVAFRWRGARWLGMAMFLGAFGAHTFALVLRWYVSGRWPNSNMFEAVTTAAWFGGCAALFLEVFAARTPMRSIFAIGSAVASMVALMCAYYLPLQLDAGISNRMPVLHDVWLYIHTNVIIFSYCLIAIAAVVAGLYLGYRLVRRVMDGPVDGSNEYARAGGAAALITLTPSGGAAINASRTTMGQVLDGATMILMELSFVMLWAGLVMGAIWADHSWGRPWGWDPKEVFALNTFIVFAVLVHVRLKAKDKGLWTALIALFGAAVMLFNWIAINFVITGLHSYA